MTETARKPLRCPECGSTEIGGPDDEGLWDCEDCCVWFEPGHPNNAACFDLTAPIVPALNADDTPKPVSGEEPSHGGWIQ